MAFYCQSIAGETIQENTKSSTKSVKISKHEIRILQNSVTFVIRKIKLLSDQYTVEHLATFQLLKDVAFEQPQLFDTVLWTYFHAKIPLQDCLLWQKSVRIIAVCSEGLWVSILCSDLFVCMFPFCHRGYNSV